MIKKTKAMQEVEVRHKYCDDCAEEIKFGVTQCYICGKDLCEKCIGHEEMTSGDYRAVYCKKCWGIGETYRARIKLMRDQIEEAQNEWEKKCMEVRHEN